ncbi:hypothetical protein BQ1740_1091 [Bacillus subtilis]|nr:hypothetical protein BQ1740_1091 [Bacillus subtilis]
MPSIYIQTATAVIKGYIHVHNIKKEGQYSLLTLFYYFTHNLKK